MTIRCTHSPPPGYGGCEQSPRRRRGYHPQSLEIHGCLQTLGPGPGHMGSVSQFRVHDYPQDLHFLLWENPLALDYQWFVVRAAIYPCEVHVGCLLWFEARSTTGLPVIGSIDDV